MAFFRGWATGCLALGAAAFAGGCKDDPPPPPVAVISTVAEAAAGGADAGVCVGSDTLDAQVGTAPSISGGCSTDPVGDILEYQWDLVDAPTGSLAEIHDPTLMTPTFTPDVDGKYVLSLVVTAGGRESEPAFVDVITSDVCGVSRPVADATVTEPTGGGVPGTCGGASIDVAAANGEILLAATGSVDPDNNAICGMSQRLDYRWEIMSMPLNGQDARIRHPNAEVTVFDVQSNGAYQVRLIVTDELGFESEPITCDLLVNSVP